MKNLIDRLNKKPQDIFPQITLDVNASKACRATNEIAIDKNEDVPAKGGSIAQFAELQVDQRNNECEEYTMVKFESQDAMEFVALELAMDWEREGDAGKKSPILDQSVTKVGISNKPHKKTQNIINILYVKSSSNAMM